VLLADANANFEQTPVKKPEEHKPKPDRIKAVVLLLFLVLPLTSHASGFSVIGTDPGCWPKILTSIGHWPSPAVDAQIYVGRPGAPASPNWAAKLAQGSILVLEGESTLAASFGFRPGKETVSLTSLEDVHRPQLPIVLERAIEIHRFQVPEGARVFARERWTGAPIIAGFRRGAGAVLWVAVSPGKNGYERFPYILQAMSDLGMAAPFQSRTLWAFFDSAYRTRVDVDYFAARWRASGIGSLHVAAWHFYEPDPERDAYLQHLIDACHRQAITVYAWIELPHVSEKFWADHPMWREKTGVLQDAQLDWRKLMNLTNRDCFTAVSKGVQDLMRRFDWDGMNLSELYFESLEGVQNPARFTPMNDDVRAEFRSKQGWDPIEIFASRKDAASLRAFLDYRADLVSRMQEEWLAEAQKIRSIKPDLDIVLTHVDDRFDTGMKDAIGADAARVLPLLGKRDFTFLIEDPATVWNLGPQRYPEIAARYAPLTPKPDRLAIDINVVDRYQDVYPTKQQTGLELFQLVHLAASAFPRVALYFENSLLKPDLALLPAAAARVDRVQRVGSKLLVDAPRGVGIPWQGPALVDGRSWPARNENIVWLPAGTHTIEPGGNPSAGRLVDFNGTLQSAQSLAGNLLEIGYTNPGQAIALVDRKPGRIEIDGKVSVRPVTDSGSSYEIPLPRGEHLVTIQFVGAPS
jgi:hypothetical protein